MPISISQLTMAIENAVFRNYIEKGIRLFTPHMFIADETGDAKAVLSVLFALSNAGVLTERLTLRERGTQNVLRMTFTGQSLAAYMKENSLDKEVEVLYAFQINEDYARVRLEAEIADAEPPTK